MHGLKWTESNAMSSLGFFCRLWFLSIWFDWNSTWFWKCIRFFFSFLELGIVILFLWQICRMGILSALYFFVLKKKTNKIPKKNKTKQKSKLRDFFLDELLLFSTQIIITQFIRVIRMNIERMLFNSRQRCHHLSAGKSQQMCDVQNQAIFSKT